MASVSCRRLSPALGVEIDCDLSQGVSDALLDEFERLFDEHHLLLFRGQQLAEETQVRIAKHFGSISRRNPAQGKKDSILVSNVAPGGVLGFGELIFHSDNTFFPHPLKAIGLYAVAVPARGGDTIFSNAIAVLEALPAEVRQQLETLTTYQVYDYDGDYNRRVSLDRVPRDAPRAIQPMIWTNPKTGRRSLLFSELTTARIEGLDAAAEASLIALLRATIADPRFCYRHQWRVGDFIFWDNVTLQHARTDFDRAAPRTLRRTPVLDPDGAARFPHSRDASLAGVG